MKAALTRHITLALILLITLIFAKLQANKLSGGEDEVCTTICSDGRGYYAWLPGIFIYHDLNFNFFDGVEAKDSLCGGPVGGCMQDYRVYHDGAACNKYYPGASFMMLPFFAAAHFITTTFTHYAPSGYSYPYFRLAGVSGIFYYMMGMLFFLAILVKMGLDTTQRAITILLVTFGTNIMYFAVDKPTYSHIYSFTLIAAFIYLLQCLRERYSARQVLLLSFITGWIFIARPVNLSILVIVPFIFRGQVRNILNEVKLKPARLALLLPGFIMPALLLGLYKISVGRFFVYSYGGESFDFLHPHFWQFLFSGTNGVFAYMPLLLMPFLLLPVWYTPAVRNYVAGAAVTLLFTCYIHSSWYCWWYGFSFGARTILDVAPLFGLVIGLSLRGADRKRYVVLLPAYLVATVLTVLLYHQKTHGYLNGFPINDYWDAIGNAIGLSTKI